MECLQYIWDNYGKDIIINLICGLLGGTGGYVFGYRKGRDKIKQKQKAGNNSMQNQIGHISVNNFEGVKNGNKSK